MGFLDFVLGRRPPSPRKSYTIYCARNAPAPERRRRPKTRSAQRQAKARRPRSLGAPTHPESLPGRGDEHAAGDAYPPPDYASTPPGGGASGSAVPPPDAPSPAKDEAILAWREQAHEASRRVGAKPAASTVPVPGGGKTRGVLTVPTVPGPNASRAVRGYDLYARNPDDVGAQGYCYPRAQCARSPRRSRPWSCLRRLFPAARHGDREPWLSSRRRGATHSSMRTYRHVGLATGTAHGSESDGSSYGSSSDSSSGSSYSSSGAD